MKAADIIDAAYGGIIGIDEGLQIFGGYDNSLQQADIGYDPREWCGEEPTPKNTMSPAEKVELANLMLARWTAYRQAVLIEPPLIPSSPAAPAAHPGA